MQYKFECPSCRSKDGLLRVNAKPQFYSDLIGATCANCGHIITDNDIKQFARALTTEKLTQALKMRK